MDATSHSEMFVSIDELASSVGISRMRIMRLVELGIVETATPNALEFSAGVALRLVRMVRLQRELGVNLTGAAIIVELVDRLEAAGGPHRSNADQGRR